jgi:hypothetical protein
MANNRVRWRSAVEAPCPRGVTGTMMMMMMTMKEHCRASRQHLAGWMWPAGRQLNRPIK